MDRTPPAPPPSGTVAAVKGRARPMPRLRLRDLELLAAGSYRLALENPHVSSPQGLARSSAR